MKFFDRISHWWLSYPRLVDGLIIVPLMVLVLFVSAGPLVSTTFPMTVYGWPVWALRSVIALIVVLHMTPWIFRRTNPVASAAFVVAGSLIHLVFGPDLVPSMVMVPLTVQNLAHRAPSWASWAGFGTALVGAFLYAAEATMLPHYWVTSSLNLPQPTPGVEDILYPIGGFYALVLATPVVALVVLAWAIGNVQRTRRIRVETLQNRAERLAIEAHQERELAAADERNRIARELHDIVAHSLQVMISQADGGRYAAKTQPDIAVRTLETISTTGRDALNQMRRLLGVLRDTDGADTTPQPGLQQVDALIETMRLSGLDVTYHQAGVPSNQLAEGVELVVYRVIQEALTNVVRHAGADATAVVTLHWRKTGVSVTIDDDGTGPTTTDGAGQGLVGMQERIALYDGTLSAGPKSGGGFRVHARLPYT